MSSSFGTLPLIDHLALRVRDGARSRRFYEQALEPLGVRVVESSQGHIGFALEGRGDFWIEEGEPAAAPVHVAFAAPDRATVDEFQRAAVEAGGRDNGTPGLRPHYHAEYYAAFVVDPDGNNVEAVFHGDASNRTAEICKSHLRLRQCSGMSPEHPRTSWKRQLLTTAWSRRDTRSPSATRPAPAPQAGAGA